MSVEDDARMIVAIAGLGVQHRCAICDRLLQAWGRRVYPSERWACPEHRYAPVPAGILRSTCAELADPGAAS